MHISCTICTDVVEPDENIHATKCGHVFHNHCLSDWIERSNTCPQCRRVVTDNCMLRIYPTFSDEKDLKTRMHQTLELYKELQIVCAAKEDQLNAANESLRKNEEALEIYISELESRNSAVEALKQNMETLEVQYSEILRLQNENTSLINSVKTLNGEIQRQNLLHSEFMAQISVQRHSLEAQARENARLTEENESLKKNLSVLNGELQRHKSLYDELTTQVSLQKDQKSDLKSPSNAKQSKDANVRMKKNIKTCDRAIMTSTKTIAPQTSPQIPDTACITDKMNCLSQKLHLAKSSQMKLSRSIVNLVVACLKLRGEKFDGQYSLSVGIGQNIYEESRTRLSQMLTMNETKLQVENPNITELGKDSISRQSGIPSRTSKLAQNSLMVEQVTTSMCNDDMKRMTDFFTKLSERKIETEKNSKEDSKIQSVILSPVNITFQQCGSNFENAIQRVLVAETLKNYEKNFKRFDIGVFKKGTEPVKRNTGRKHTKLEESKEAFVFDASKSFGARRGRPQPVFEFSARRVPPPPPPPAPLMPPLPAQLKKLLRKYTISTFEELNKQLASINNQPKKKCQPSAPLWPPHARPRRRTLRPKEVTLPEIPT